jgi:hypothetical protein
MQSKRFLALLLKLCNPLFFKFCNPCCFAVTANLLLTNVRVTNKPATEVTSRPSWLAARDHVIPASSQAEFAGLTTRLWRFRRDLAPKVNRRWHVDFGDRSSLLFHQGEQTAAGILWLHVLDTSTAGTAGRFVGTRKRAHSKEFTASSSRGKLALIQIEHVTQV